MYGIHHKLFACTLYFLISLSFWPSSYVIRSLPSSILPFLSFFNLSLFLALFLCYQITPQFYSSLSILQYQQSVLQSVLNLMIVSSSSCLTLTAKKCLQQVIMIIIIIIIHVCIHMYVLLL